MLTNSHIIGGTSSVIQNFVPMPLAKYNLRYLINHLHGRIKQWEMAKLYGDEDRVHFLIGDARDKNRRTWTLSSVSHLVHAAATKIAPTFACNLFECLKTNMKGTMIKQSCKKTGNIR